MAEAEGPQKSLSASFVESAGFKITTTMPDEIPRHNISDEQLAMLIDMRRDYLWEGMWGALGVSLASAVAAIASIIGHFSKSEPMSVAGLFYIVVFFVSTAIFGVLCYVTWGKSRSAVALGK